MGDTETDESFVAFVDEHAGGLLQTARLLSGSQGPAEDLVQDTLTALYPDWARVEAARAPVAYVRRALINRFNSALRRAYRRPGDRVALRDTSDRATSVQETVPGSQYVADPSTVVADRDLVDRLLETLAPRPRAAVVCRYLHDMSDADIAEALNCRPGTVRSLLSRAIATLREEWVRSELPPEGCWNEGTGT